MRLVVFETTIWVVHSGVASCAFVHGFSINVGDFDFEVVFFALSPNGFVCDFRFFSIEAWNFIGVSGVHGCSFWLMGWWSNELKCHDV